MRVHTVMSNKSGLAVRAALLSLALVLSACGPRAEQEEQSKSQGACTPRGENLIGDKAFATLFAQRSEQQWQSSEHAAGGTYEPSVTDGVLSIRKIGSEPWFLVAQSVDAKVLAGNTLAFSAELKLDLHEPKHAHGFDYGGGLSVMARRGGKVVVNSTMEHEPNFGVHDWQPVEVIFKLPRNSTYMRLGFVHQAGGSIAVRNPALYVMDPDCPVTVGERKPPAQPGRPSALGRLSTGQ